MDEEDFLLLVDMARATFEEEARELIVELLAVEGVRRIELARRTGTSPSYITNVLNGRQSPSVGFLTKALCALGYQPRLEATPL